MANSKRLSDWLTIVRLPPYAPDLNPVEGVWAHLKKSLANLAPRVIEDLAPLAMSRLRSIQRRPDVIDDFYRHLTSWLAEQGSGAQVIIVDNSPPALVEDNVVVRYSRSEEGPPYGLIDDETTAEEDGQPPRRSQAAQL